MLITLTFLNFNVNLNKIGVDMDSRNVEDCQRIETQGPKNVINN